VAQLSLKQEGTWGKEEAGPCFLRRGDRVIVGDITGGDCRDTGKKCSQGLKKEVRKLGEERNSLWKGGVRLADLEGISRKERGKGQTF